MKESPPAKLLDIAVERDVLATSIWLAHSMKLSHGYNIEYNKHMCLYILTCVDLKGLLENKIGRAYIQVTDGHKGRNENSVPTLSCEINNWRNSLENINQWTSSILSWPSTYYNQCSKFPDPGRSHVSLAIPPWPVSHKSLRSEPVHAKLFTVKLVWAVTSSWPNGSSTSTPSPLAVTTYPFAATFRPSRI